MSSILSRAGAGVVVALVLPACDRNEPPRQSAPKPVAPLVTAASSAAPQPVPPAAAASSAAPRPPTPAPSGLHLGPPAGVSPDTWNAGGKCNLEAIDGAVFNGKPLVVKSGAHPVLTGWALDPEGNAVPDVVHVRFSSPKAGEYYGTAARRVFREDVNAANPVQPKTAESGFELPFDSNQLPEGAYSVTTVMLFGEKSFICDNGRKVTRVR